MYVIVKYKNEHKSYLNQRDMDKFTFNSDDAWTTTDLELAVRLLVKIKKTVDTSKNKVCIESCVPLF